MRFYPDALPSYTNEPTRDRFDIRFIGDGVGEGVVSLASFKEGDLIFVFTGFLLNEITQFTLQVNSAGDLHLHDPYFMGKVLHSCDPNASVDMSARTFRAVRDIAPGDFITMDYAQTEDRLFKPFQCGCGAANCRGFVTGRLENTEVFENQSS